MFIALFADISAEDFLSLFQLALLLLCFGVDLKGNGNYTRDSLMIMVYGV